MYIKSGDIVVMSGPARLSYHGVPKIISSSCSALAEEPVELETKHILETDSKGTCTCDSCKEVFVINDTILRRLQTLDWKNYEIYLRTSRINMNVRQVLRPGEKLEESEVRCTSEDDPPLPKALKVS